MPTSDPLRFVTAADAVVEPSPVGAARVAVARRPDRRRAADAGPGDDAARQGPRLPSPSGDGGDHLRRLGPRRAMGRPRRRGCSARARSRTSRRTSSTAPTTPATATLVFLAILSPAVFEGPALVDVSGEAPWASLRAGRRALIADADRPPRRHARHQGRGIRLRPRSAAPARRATTLVMDLGVLGEPAFAAGHPGGGRGPRRRRRPGRAARRARSRRRPSTPCCAAPARWSRRCTRDGRIDGVLGLGGGGGTAMITAAMRTLPVGVPKLMVSTLASGNTAPVRRRQRHHADAVGGRHRRPQPAVAPHPRQRRRRHRRHGRPGADRGRRARRAAAAAARGDDVRRDHAVRDRGARSSSKPPATTCWSSTPPAPAAGRWKRSSTAASSQGVLDVTTTEWCDEVVGGVLERRARSARRRGAGGRSRRWCRPARSTW